MTDRGSGGAGGTKRTLVLAGVLVVGVVVIVSRIDHLSDRPLVAPAAEVILCVISEDNLTVLVEARGFVSVGGVSSMATDARFENF